MEKYKKEIFKANVGFRKSNDKYHFVLIQISKVSLFDMYECILKYVGKMTLKKSINSEKYIFLQKGTN